VKQIFVTGSDPWQSVSVGGQFFRLDGQALQMLEPRLVAGNRRVESGKGGCENLDAIEVSACFFERAIELVFHPIDCSLCRHTRPTFPPGR